MEKLNNVMIAGMSKTTFSLKTAVFHYNMLEWLASGKHSSLSEPLKVMHKINGEYYYPRGLCYITFYDYIVRMG
jgi:hypothetical protein